MLALTYGVRDSVFVSLFHIIENYNFGWLLRYIHFNGASFFFFCIFIHIGRGLYYNSYINLFTWLRGCFLLVLIMAVAFLGYVLPINQMSFWGASVITNLFREVPVFGSVLVSLIWGGFIVSDITVNRFFCLHFLIPFFSLFFVFSHIIFLHVNGSSNPVGVVSSFDKLVFFLYSTKKDIYVFFFALLVGFFFILVKPNLLGDNENFVKSNFLITPHHIQPEWYFLCFYAILRSIPNKLGGIVALLISVIIFFLLPFINKINQSPVFRLKKKIFFWIFISCFIFLTYIGACPVEMPYTALSQLSSIIYFYFLIF